MTRRYVEPVGFVTLPDSLAGADAAVRNVAKVSVEFSADLEPGHATAATWHASDKLLIDLGALDGELNLDKVSRDCELVNEAVRNNKAVIAKAVAALRRGDHAGMHEAEELFRSVGLDEASMAKAGGGILWLIVVVAAAALSGCGHSGSQWGRPPHPPVR